MAAYKTFLKDRMKIEVEGDSAGPATPMAPAFLGSLERMSKEIAAHIRKLDEEDRPTELVIDFGVKALSDGTYAVSLGSEGANFRISMSWESTGGEGQSVPIDLPEM